MQDLVKMTEVVSLADCDRQLAMTFRFNHPIVLSLHNKTHRSCSALHMLSIPGGILFITLQGRGRATDNVLQKVRGPYLSL